MSNRWESLGERLLTAAASGDKAALGRLVAAGADVEVENEDGWTASILAAFNGHDACLALLIKAGGGP